MPTELEYQQELKRKDDLISEALALARRTISEFNEHILKMELSSKDLQLTYEKVLAEKEKEIERLKTLVPIGN
jgi:hypothetical protein